MESVFRDLRVVELASVLAGPAVGMFFAELGAAVVKIENARTGGDVTRRWKTPGEDPQATDSAYYHCVNWGKTVRMLDLEAADDRAEAHALIDCADVVISNYRPESAARLEMDYATLRTRNPRLIYAQLTAFGAGDPGRPAFDVVLQAESGFLYMSGEPGRPPARMPVALIDLLAAHQLKEGILLALLRRQGTGEGAYVTTSLFESAVASLANQATNYLMAGYVPGPMGSRHPNIAPYGDVFTCADDKPVVVAAGTEKQFRRLCACLGLPALPDDARFATNAARVRRREDLVATLAPAFRQRSRAEVMATLLEHDVPAGAIRAMPEVFELPAARNMILEETGPGGRVSRRVKTVAFHFGEEK